MTKDVTRREFVRAAGVAALAAAAVPRALAQADRKITAAVAGCAHSHTPGYIDLLKKRGDVKVKWVWDHDAGRAEKYARELGAEAVTEPDRIWSDPEVGVVVICSETNRHHDLVLAGAKAGKAMFVEKPLGIAGKESMEMAEAIEQAHLLFTTGYGMRTDPKHLFLRQEIAKGNLGQVTRARGSCCHNGSLGHWFDTDIRWMADPKIAGVGAFGDLGTHKLDILMWLIGDVDSVTADIRVVTGHYGDCDETGEGLIQFKNGVIGSLAAAWVDVDDPVQLVVSGTEGHAAIVDNRLYYMSKKVPGSSNKQPLRDLPTAPRTPLHQLLDAVGGAKDQPLVAPREAAARVAVMEAMYRAARQRTWVRVEIG